MSELFTLCGIGLCAVFAISVIREIHNGYVKWIILAFTVLCISAIIPNIRETVNFMKDASARGGGVYVETVLKALGITYLTSTASEICISSGESAVGEKIETVGKIEILTLTVPLFRELLEMSLI